MKALLGRASEALLIYIINTLNLSLSQTTHALILSLSLSHARTDTHSLPLNHSLSHSLPLSRAPRAKKT